MDPQAHYAHYMRGLSMIRNRTVAEGPLAEEALKSLRIAAERYPHPHLAVAQLFEDQGRRDEAVTELRAYLDSPEPPFRRDVERWLARLSPVSQPSRTAQGSEE